MHGKEIRLKRLFKHSDKMFIVPMDHGISAGPISGLTDISRAVESVEAGGADAIIVHKGMVRWITEFLNPAGCELIVHLSASTDLSPLANKKELVASVEHAIKLGATAVSVHVNLADNAEAQMLKDLGQVAEQCDLWEIPLLAMMYVRDGSRESEYDPDKISHAARVAEEVGADIVKVNYTGSPESFARVLSAVHIPVVIAGGPKMASTANLLEMIFDATEVGAAGISIGRNIFQYQDPAQLSATIRKILDQKITRDCLEEFR
ncbi:DeoC/FbaB/ lacD aldolase [Syntrophomonas zehnderi OL-4]|uniref:2-amino-3,7-dideoxy-D-threo-hept-6-ulosonate synthase n=1 Tax=Syntrophomonas zehnderi OL-4 TaxID=690567 RepID=A0A0E3W3F3_9FIRM|nr:2-amino-3,7-dideoxy-D-threo-hept-6-ulosonate synthase [Syntrophomonas zehnderi]CFX77924.1 DeoC/FbaB/ lacD aldolase [Syntrophomonas zehnderi OL-4]